MKRLACLLALLLAAGCLGGCASAPRQTDAQTSAAASDADVCTYTVRCCDGETGEGIEGVIVNFCTDAACTPVTSSETGEAVFTGPPERYHVEIVRVPKGWKLTQASDWYTGTSGGTYRILFEAEAAP